MYCSRIFVAAFCLLLRGGIAEELNKYCSLCRSVGTHTLCRYPDAGPGSKCSGYKKMPLSPEEQDRLVDIHNKMRNKVALGRETRGNSGPQSPASDMRQLSWDDELAEIAQRWADQCIEFHSIYQHDICRDSERFLVGQNIAASGSTISKEYRVENWVQKWYDEVDDYNKNWVQEYQELTSVPPVKIGHYTQLVWATSYLLGCARVVFKEYRKGEPWFFARLVCNYGPAGNFLHTPVYKTGKACSSCPSKRSCSPLYTGLCATSREIQDALNILEVKDSNATRQDSGTTALFESSSQIITILLLLLAVVASMLSLTKIAL